jgi:hypothetical protein
MTLNNETIVALGWAIGQFVTTAIAVLFLQQRINKGVPDEKFVGYFKAAGIYFNREMGNLVIGFAGLLVMLFIFPDYWDADINRMDLKIKSTLTWKERTMVAQRTTTFIIGALVQLILILGFKKGQKAVEKYADKIV